MDKEMDKIVNLINLLEISRAQPQYGYAMAGGNTRLGNLAEHHYMVTMLGWQLTELVNNKGAGIDLNKVFKFCLLHDIGELLGGDIGMYYGEANPKAKKLAKNFEEENQKFLSSFFSDQKEMESLSKEILDSTSDEAHVAKVADYMELIHYRLFTNALRSKDIELVAPKLKDKISKIKNKIAQKELNKFVESWKKKMLSYDSFLDASTKALGV